MADLLGLADRVEQAVQTLANTPMQLDLGQWSDIANPLLEAAARVRVLEDALRQARDVIATMADCLSPLVTEALVGTPLENIDAALHPTTAEEAHEG